MTAAPNGEPGVGNDAAEIGAEYLVLAAMLVHPAANFYPFVDFINPDDFRHPAHVMICRAILDVYESGMYVDVDAVAITMHGAGDLDRVGGLSYVCGLVRTVPSDQLVPTFLYRWYDAEGELLYVGITRNLAARWESHWKRSSWVQFAAQSTARRYIARELAEFAEVAAIEVECPLFNSVHNNTVEARERLVAYLVRRGRYDLLAPAISRG